MLFTPVWFVLSSFVVVVVLHFEGDLSSFVVIVVVLHFEGDTDVLTTFHKLVLACCLPLCGLFCHHLLLLFYTLKVIQMC